MDSGFGRLLSRLEKLCDRLEEYFPKDLEPPEWKNHVAYRWIRRRQSAVLAPVARPHQIKLTDLIGLDEQKRLLVENTLQFLRGYTANNILLTGSRGTGKSSLIKAILNEYSSENLKLIEIDKGDLVDLPEVIECVSESDSKFLIFCDDLSFEGDDFGYKALKSTLDGSIATSSDNVLIYATSNRRHLMPELMKENNDTKYLGDEIHPGESVEEKLSLSERFGLWINFYPFDQEAYLKIVDHWVSRIGNLDEKNKVWHREALQWALLRGSRSGRVARQFSNHWVGKRKLQEFK